MLAHYSKYMPEEYTRYWPRPKQTPKSDVQRRSTSRVIKVLDRSAVVLPRLQATSTHLAFAGGNPHLDATMLPIEDARRLVDQGETANSVFDDSTLVGVSTAISDDKLETWFPGRETMVIRSFNPDFYLPCDRPVYRGDSLSERQDIIRRYLHDLEEIDEALNDHPVVIIPFVKGVTTAERRRCYNKFKELGIDRIAYYCVQYFQYGNRGSELLADVRKIATEASPNSLLVVGLQAPQYLRQLPPVVNAAAGQRWIRKSGLPDDKLTMTQIQSNYGKWKRQLESELSGGQTGLTRWLAEPGGVYGD